MVVSPDLPAEIIGSILDHLSVPDLCRSAQVSLLFKDLVYDESRWVAKLKSMGVWSDAAARQHAENELFLRMQKINGRKPIQQNSPDMNHAATPIDVPATPQRSDRRAKLISLTPGSMQARTDDTESNVIHVLQNVKSIRGRARQEFAKVWGALSPLYEDIATAKAPSDPVIFRRFRLPEDQARILKQLVLFGNAHAVENSTRKNLKLVGMVELFEKAALREFEIGYDNRDEEQMTRYSNVLDLLNGGKSCINTFCRKNILFINNAPNPFECFDSFSDDNSIDLSPMGKLTDSLALEMTSQKQVIYRVFDNASLAWQTFVERIFTYLLSDYVNKLIDYAQQQSSRTYLLAFTGSYQHLRNMIAKVGMSTEGVIDFKDARSDLDPVNEPVRKGSRVETLPDSYLLELLQKVYEEHVSDYLEEELSEVRQGVIREVLNWDKQIKTESQQTEQLYLSGVNRDAAKKNFLQSFTKVILMPVNVVGSVMPFPNRPIAVNDSSQPAGIIAGNNEIADGTSAALPTTELAARAAIMNSGLARIKRLLSVEVALQLIHKCKESIDRARSFVNFTGRVGEEAREQCETMFSVMIQALGARHVQGGFDLALNSLKSFEPRNNKQVAEVQPLVDFLELVHVGDLIQQMVDVFYNQELSGIIDQTDFLSPAVKEKKKFELMIDEKVAEGLNRGIDVLIDQVEYILVTTQKPTDFKPWLVLGKDDHLDLRETETAVAVVKCLRTHTDLLRGSTDKSTLDVFFQEVGLRLFGSLCKHFKRQSITVEGGLKLISDLNYYHAFILTLKQSSIVPYFAALKELGNMYIISGRDGKAVGQVISDIARFGGVLRPEDVYEFAERRADWQKVKKHVDRVIYGTTIGENCVIS